MKSSFSWYNYLNFVFEKEVSPCLLWKLSPRAQGEIFFGTIAMGALRKKSKSWSRFTVTSFCDNIAHRHYNQVFRYIVLGLWSISCLAFFSIIDRNLRYTLGKFPKRRLILFSWRFVGATEKDFINHWKGYAYVTVCVNKRAYGDVRPLKDHIKQIFACYFLLVNFVSVSNMEIAVEGIELFGCHTRILFLSERLHTGVLLEAP